VVKAHYLARQSKDLESKRQEAETKAVSGIMSLGLLQDEDDNPSPPPPPKQQPKSDDKKGGEGSDSSES